MSRVLAPFTDHSTLIPQTRPLAPAVDSLWDIAAQSASVGFGDTHSLSRTFGLRDIRSREEELRKLAVTGAIPLEVQQAGGYMFDWTGETEYDYGPVDAWARENLEDYKGAESLEDMMADIEAFRRAEAEELGRMVADRPGTGHAAMIAGGMVPAILDPTNIPFMLTGTWALNTFRKTSAIKKMADSSRLVAAGQYGLAGVAEGVAAEALQMQLYGPWLEEIGRPLTAEDRGAALALGGVAGGVLSGAAGAWRGQRWAAAEVDARQVRAEWHEARRLLRREDAYAEGVLINTGWQRQTEVDTGILTGPVFGEANWRTSQAEVVMQMHGQRVTEGLPDLPGTGADGVPIPRGAAENPHIPLSAYASSVYHRATPQQAIDILRNDADPAPGSKFLRVYNTTDFIPAKAGVVTFQYEASKFTGKADHTRKRTPERWAQGDRMFSVKKSANSTVAEQVDRVIIDLPRVDASEKAAVRGLINTLRKRGFKKTVGENGELVYTRPKLPAGSMPRAHPSDIEALSRAVYDVGRMLDSLEKYTPPGESAQWHLGKMMETEASLSEPIGSAALMRLAEPVMPVHYPVRTDAPDTRNVREILPAVREMAEDMDDAAVTDAYNARFGDEVEGDTPDPGVDAVYTYDDIDISSRHTVEAASGDLSKWEAFVRCIRGN